MYIQAVSSIHEFNRSYDTSEWNGETTHSITRQESAEKDREIRGIYDYKCNMYVYMCTYVHLYIMILTL
jgi:hypothetical protein